MKKNNNLPEWFKPKCYLHFMERIEYRDYKWVKNKVTNQDWVAKYNFYPFIHRTIINRRYKKLQYQNCNLQTYRSHIDVESLESTAKKREIHYPNHLDGIIYSYYAKEKLGKKYEELLNLKENHGLEKCITAYRKTLVEGSSNKGKCNIHFAYDVFTHIRKVGDCVALTFDIEKFFPSLDHSILKDAWNKVIGGNKGDKLPCDHFNVYKAITSFWYVEENDLLNELNLLKYGKGKSLKRKTSEIKSYCKNERDFRVRICGGQNKKRTSLLRKSPYINQGIPQGTAISALLANIYMFEFDKCVFEKIKDIEGGLYRRYSDDIVIVCPQNRKTEIHDFIEKTIKSSYCKLTVNSEKTEVIYFKNEHIEDDTKPLRYLGFEFDGKRILIKASTLSKYHRRMKSFIKRKYHKTNILRKFKNEDSRIWRKQIMKKYSEKGKGNFISYALKAEKLIGEGSIIDQIRSHKRKIAEYIENRQLAANNAHDDHPA